MECLIFFYNIELPIQKQIPTRYSFLHLVENLLWGRPLITPGDLVLFLTVFPLDALGYPSWYVTPYFEL